MQAGRARGVTVWRVRPEGEGRGGCGGEGSGWRACVCDPRQCTARVWEYSTSATTPISTLNLQEQRKALEKTKDSLLACMLHTDIASVPVQCGRAA